MSFEFFISVMFGAIAGSFGAATGNRLSHSLSLAGRSRCDDCGIGLRVTDLIPVISFLFLRGKCRHCKKNIKREYFLAELLSISIFLLVTKNYFQIGIWVYILAFLVSTSLTGIIVADWQTHLIPDELLILLMIGILGLLFPYSQVMFISRVLIALIAAGIFFCIWWFTSGRGMGFGDVKLVGLLAFWLGKEKIWVGLYLAFLLAAVCGLIFIVKDRATLKTRIAFGPFLIFGCILGLEWGETFVRFWQDYLQFLK